MISITTTGPINTMPDILKPQDKTFNDLVVIISDEIDDTTNEYLQQIQNTIFTAIRFCEREPLYFNESRDVCFKTKAGQQWYDKEDDKNIATSAGIAALYLEESTISTKLRLYSQDEMERLSGEPSRGRPYAYSYYNRKLALYPLPDRAYSVRLHLMPLRFEQVKTADEMNPWFMEAFDLVKARAKYELYKDILKDAVMAAAAYNDFNEQLQSLRYETSRRSALGQIKATRF